MVKKRKLIDSLAKALILFGVFSIIIVGVSVYFVFDEVLIGPAFLVLGLASLFSLKFFDVPAKGVYPDIIFAVFK